MLRVALFPEDEGAGARYRMTEPARVLADHPGLEVTIGGPLFPVRWSGRFDTEFPPVGIAPVELDVPPVDLVVLQRPLYHFHPETIRLLRAGGVAVAIEIDDDFETIDPRNPAWAGSDPKRNPSWNRAHLMASCHAADLVIASTPAVARRYGTRTPAVVCPNLVPAAYLQLGADPGERPPVAGWSGWIASHPGDLEVPRGGVGRAVARSGGSWLTVGEPAGVLEALAVTSPAEGTGWVPIDAYPAQLARLAVGVVPLAATAFNRSKSWLKGIEMAAVGAAVVATPSPEYEALAALDVCQLAERPRAWEQTVAALLRDAPARADKVATARSAVRSLTYEARAADLWPQAWADAVANLRRYAPPR